MHNDKRERIISFADHELTTFTLFCGFNLQNILNFNITWPWTVKNSWPTCCETLE